MNFKHILLITINRTFRKSEIRLKPVTEREISKTMKTEKMLKNMTSSDGKERIQTMHGPDPEIRRRPDLNRETLAGTGSQENLVSSLTLVIHLNTNLRSTRLCHAGIWFK